MESRAKKIIDKYDNTKIKDFDSSLVGAEAQMVLSQELNVDVEKIKKMWDKAIDSVKDLGASPDDPIFFKLLKKTLKKLLGVK